MHPEQLLVLLSYLGLDEKEKALAARLHSRMSAADWNVFTELAGLYRCMPLTLICISYCRIFSTRIRGKF